jgi:hypothetical protein
MRRLVEAGCLSEFEWEDALCTTHIRKTDEDDRFRGSCARSSGSRP